MRLYRMLEAVDACPAPVVCCVHGYRARRRLGARRVRRRRGRGPDAVFGFTEVRLGIVPAVISPFVLARIGSAARRYFVTGERFGAEVALRIGLVSGGLGGPGEAAERDRRRHRRGRARVAVREAKRLVRERPDGLETAHIAATRRTSAEGQDGLRAFLERRAPGWTRRRGLARARRGTSSARGTGG